MKKLIAVIGILTLITPLYATQLKYRIAKLEKQVSALARNYSRTWKEIATLNEELSQLERPANVTKNRNNTLKIPHHSASQKMDMRVKY